MDHASFCRILGNKFVGSCIPTESFLLFLILGCLWQSFYFLMLYLGGSCPSFFNLLDNYDVGSCIPTESFLLLS